MKGKIIGIVAFFLCAQSALISQEVQITANVSSDSILLGNYFILEIKTKGNASDYVLPNLKDFEVVGGPNTSMSTTMINGKVDMSKTISYYLEPSEVGQYFVEPIVLNIEDESYSTDPIEINVFPNPEGIIENPSMNGNNSFFNFDLNDFFGDDLLPKFEQQELPEQESDTIKKRVLKKI